MHHESQMLAIQSSEETTAANDSASVIRSCFRRGGCQRLAWMRGRIRPAVKTYRPRDCNTGFIGALRPPL